jgi:hypothetical protein
VRVDHDDVGRRQGFESKTHGCVKALQPLSFAHTPCRATVQCGRPCRSRHRGAMLPAPLWPRR